MKKQTLFLAILLAAGLTSSRGQDTWTQKADFGGGIRELAVGFSIGSKGYIGTGLAGAYPLRRDFWEYDPATDAWTQKADFGGSGRQAAVAFSILSKPSIATG
jgi:N-acetylneuraminic acid mutarotase